MQQPPATTGSVNHTGEMWTSLVTFRDFTHLPTSRHDCFAASTLTRQWAVIACHLDHNTGVDTKSTCWLYRLPDTESLMIKPISIWPGPSSIGGLVPWFGEAYIRLCGYRDGSRQRDVKPQMLPVQQKIDLYLWQKPGVETSACHTRRAY